MLTPRYERFLAWLAEHVLLDIDRVNVIVTDRDKKLKAALDRIFPHVHHHLCEWHIIQNIRSKSSKLKARPLRKFIKQWKKHVLYARTLEDLEAGVQRVQSM